MRYITHCTLLPREVNCGLFLADAKKKAHNKRQKDVVCVIPLTAIEFYFILGLCLVFSQTVISVKAQNCPQKISFNVNNFKKKKLSLWGLEWGCFINSIFLRTLGANTLTLTKDNSNLCQVLPSYVVDNLKH